MSTTREISFDVSPRESQTIHKIVKRALLLPWPIESEPSALTLSMDVTACHANGTPLALEDLLGADRSNFAHDIGGIHRYMDRSTGKLTDHFVPRYSAR